MNIHVKIPRVTDFYVIFSHTDPYAADHETIVNEVNVNPQSLDEERLAQSYDRINMWIGNCDQKASFLLAIIGIVLTIALDKDVIKGFKNQIVTPCIQYWSQNIGEFYFARFLFALSLMACMVLLLSAIVYLLFSLKAKTVFDKKKHPALERQSMLYYDDIASRTYQEFVEGELHMLNDLRSQVYTNACICSDKFKNYRKGSKLFLWAIPFSVITLIFYMFL